MFRLPLRFHGCLPTIAAVVVATGLVQAQEAGAPAGAQPSGPVEVQRDPGSREVVRVRIASIIHPVARDLLVESLERADREGAEALVVELDTPGGLLTSTREMTTAMLGAKTPVVVWVAPNGAQAASAGFFLLMASDVAAMAPSTNTGAAHPVGGQGESIEGHLGEKIEQDSAAMIRTLAERRGRPLDLAEKAVVESLSFTASEAKENGLIEIVAEDESSLLEALDGMVVEKPKGARRVLATAGARVEAIEMNAVQRFLSVLLHPNVAYLLMSIGFLGIYFELSHPGAVFPGVIGGIALLLALYALSVLPTRFAGVALILLVLGLLIAEIKVTSYGLLTVGGLAALTLGSLVLFRSPDPTLRVSLDLVVAVVVVVGGVAAGLAWLAARAHRSRVTTGSGALVGSRATVRERLDPAGKVFVFGEWWNAVADSTVEPGDEVEVLAVDGLRLRVRRISDEQWRKES